MNDHATAALGGKRKRKLSTREMSIRKTANGGFIARHQMTDANGLPPSDASHEQEYGLSDKAALLAHVDEHMGDDQPDSSEDA